MKVRIALMGALVMLLVSGLALAAPAKSQDVRRSAARDAKRLMGALDIDRDGVVSRTELWIGVRSHISQRCKVRFGEMDRDADGRVTRSEAPGLSAARFARYDADGNGVLTLAELDAHMVRCAWSRLPVLMARIDTDGNGSCCKDELAAHRHMIGETREPERMATRDEAKASF